MNIIVCVDDNKGMLFDGKRLSKDRKVTDDIINMLGRKKLYINSFSADLFESEYCVICDDFLEIAKRDDFCFAENVDLSQIKERIDGLVIYRWNRKYPSDFKFDLPFYELKLKLVGSFDFKGYSHDKITKEVYKK